MISVPDKLTIAFARELVAYLGGDPTPIQYWWCWRSLIIHYKAILPQAIELIKDKMSGWDIRCVLIWQPQLIDMLPTNKMGGEDIYCVLRNQPQLVDKLPVKRLDDPHIDWLLYSQPQLANKLKKKVKK